MTMNLRYKAINKEYSDWNVWYWLNIIKQGGVFHCIMKYTISYWRVFHRLNDVNQHDQVIFPLCLLNYYHDYEL